MDCSVAWSPRDKVALHVIESLNLWRDLRIPPGILNVLLFGEKADRVRFLTYTKNDSLCRFGFEPGNSVMWKLE